MTILTSVSSASHVPARLLDDARRGLGTLAGIGASLLSQDVRQGHAWRWDLLGKAVTPTGNARTRRVPRPPLFRSSPATRDGTPKYSYLISPDRTFPTRLERRSLPSVRRWCRGELTGYDAAAHPGRGTRGGVVSSRFGARRIGRYSRDFALGRLLTLRRAAWSHPACLLA
jgi:hypothetical protein